MGLKADPRTGLNTNGKPVGRPSKLDEDGLRQVLLTRGTVPDAAIARMLGVSRSTVTRARAGITKKHAPIFDTLTPRKADGDGKR